MLLLKVTLSISVLFLFCAQSGCPGAQSLPSGKPEENLAGPGNLTTALTPTPAHPAELTVLLPNARTVPVSVGVIQGMAIQQVQPISPLEAQAKGLTGEVNIRVSINQEGQLGEAVALTGHPLLQTAALTAVKQWRWRPTAIDTDAPVYVQGTLTFHFPPRS